MTEKLIEKLRQAGIDVQPFNAVQVNSDEGRKILNELTNMSVNYTFKDNIQADIKKDSVTASEKSNESKSNGTVVSESDTKVDKILQNLGKHYQKSSNYAKGFITDVARSLAFERHGQSQYRNFILPNGQMLSVRLSKHNDKISNFDIQGEKEGLSIIISPDKNKGLNNNGQAHVTEWYYSKQQLESVKSGKPLADIVKALRNALQTGVYTDTTGLGVRQEVNAEKMFMQIMVGQHKPFYSNAEKAVMDVKQDKAAPAQWLAMLTNKGGIKAGEDKWLGLSQWLKDSTEKSLTKSQVLDYINSHRIILHEDSYAEIRHMKKYKELNDEYVRRINEAPEKWREANRELNAFYDEMKVKYGDVYNLEYQEQMRINELLEQRDRFDDGCYNQYDRAFEEMIDKYGKDFDNAFFYEFSDLKILDEALAARKFLDEGVIDEQRLEHTTEGLDKYKELAFWVEDIEAWEETDSIHFGEVGWGRCIGWVRFGETVTPVALSAEEVEKSIQNMPKADAWVKTDGSNFVTGHDVYYPPGHTSRYVPTDFIAHHKEKGVFVFSPYRGADVVCGSLEEAVDIYNRNHAETQKKVRTLVIDEIQSRRHQEGRTEGYYKEMAPDDPQRIKFERIQKEYEEFCLSIYDKYGHTCPIDRFSPEDRVLMDQWRSRKNQAWLDYDQYQRNNNLGRFCKSNIPEAPFEKNWHELAMKRMLRYAAENGFDKVAWTTGQQQIDRYDIGRVVDSIDVYTDPHPAADERAAWKTVTCRTEFNPIKMQVNKAGHIVNDVQMGNMNLQGKSLGEVLGKDYAQAIMSMPNGKQTIDTGSFTIGGQGMKSFYDRILPEFLNKYGKQWGSAVHPFELSQLNESILEGDGEISQRKCIMHAIDITPAMKASVMQGQPMFMRDKQGELYGFTMGDTVYLTPKGMRPETVVHEYTHLWAMAMMNGNPEGWRSVKDLLKDTALWDEVRQDPLYADIRDNEDYVASEALARISGKANAHKIEDMARKTEERNKAAGRNTTGQSVVRSLRSALGKFWSWVGTHMFDIKEFSVIGEVTDRVLHDLLKGTRLETGKVIARPQTVSNPRITDVTVYEGKLGVPHIRCKVDGVQQMGRPMTREDFEQWAVSREADNLADKYFKQELDNTQNNVKNWKR